MTYHVDQHRAGAAASSDAEAATRTAAPAIRTGFGHDLAYVAMGANLGHPKQQMVRAAQLISELGEVVAKSSLYRTAPMGPPGQPDYLNAVLLFRPGDYFSDPRQLLKRLLAIELKLGRVRRERWGPRTIDLDLLDYCGRIVSAAETTTPGSPDPSLPSARLPHPAIQERSFVLVPLCEVSPEWRHPVVGKSACQLVADLDRSGIERLPDVW